MDSPHPVAIYWGDQLIDLVNDAALPAVGGQLIAVFIWKRPDSHNDETSSEYRAG
jgi:hypothetical protein